MILEIIAGAVIIAIALWEAFEGVVLPRRATRRFRFNRPFYRSTWRPWRAIAQRMRRSKRRETFLSFYGPLSLLFLFVFWAIGLILGFSLLYYGVSRHSPSPPDYRTCLYLSGSTFFTLLKNPCSPLPSKNSTAM